MSGAGFFADTRGSSPQTTTVNREKNATATTIHAHRHTVAYRLERVKDLTALDPLRSEDRERLGLGLKAYRIIAPSLPR